MDLLAGKTMTARIIASQAGVLNIPVGVVSKWYGESAKVGTSF